MKIRNFIIAVMLSTSPSVLYPQTGTPTHTDLSIEGRILDKKTHKPIAYAHVYDKTSGKGTLSNLDGYFRLYVRSLTDTVYVSIIGYKNRMLDLGNKDNFYEVFLEQNILLLKEVIVSGDDTYLYDLLADCKKQQSKKLTSGKVYYELKSFVNKHQVELVECFYNGLFSGYDLSELELKYGRIALQQNENMVFVSVETSRAIAMLKLFDRNEYLPFSPMELSKKMLKENYFLSLSNKYNTDNNDLIYIVDFKPKVSSGSSFSGQVWIDYAKKNVIKIKLNCQHVVQHPFLPLTVSDTIKNVDIEITKTFQEVGGTMFFKHIDFGYAITYKNRNNSLYKVSTNAVLYCYDTSSVFTFPYFTFADASDEVNYNHSDYLKINTVPYNDFFWKNNEELKLNEEHNQNELFYNDENSITNKTYSPLSEIVEKGLQEQPYLIWSGNRIQGREFTVNEPMVIDPQSQNDIDNPFRAEERCNISVKMLVDVNSLNGKFNYNTATVLDPYESYYNFRVNNRVLCFINIYFDLMEIERRKLSNEIENSDKSTETIKNLYKSSNNRIQELNQKYFKDRTYGKNEKEMKIWNELVIANLRIDNIALFKPFGDK
jgi:hypothetical protein